MLRVALRSLVVLVVGFCVGMLLTAPIVGWPHVFTGLLMNAPEPLREITGLAIIGITPLIFLRALWRRIKR